MAVSSFCVWGLAQEEEEDEGGGGLAGGGAHTQFALKRKMLPDNIGRRKIKSGSPRTRWGQSGRRWRDGAVRRGGRRDGMRQ